jgi:hypothetical protein
MCIRVWVFVLVLAMAVCFVDASPYETHAVLDDFHESVEMRLGFKIPPADVAVLYNGLILDPKYVAYDPTLGEVCGVNPLKNMTLIMVTTDGVSTQRALYILGNIPANSKQKTATIKLPYEVPSAEDGKYHVIALFEMDHYIPRWFPGECTTNNGTELINVCDDDGKCALKWVEKPTCVAWRALPSTNAERDLFDLKTFAADNGLTILDTLWFKVGDAPTDDTGTGMTKTSLLALQPAAAGSQSRVMGARHFEEIDGDGNVAIERLDGELGECIMASMDKL